MMLGVLIYSYCVGEHSSRRIEQRLVDDAAFRLLAANRHPDHASCLGSGLVTKRRSPDCSPRCWVVRGLRPGRRRGGGDRRYQDRGQRVSVVEPAPARPQTRSWPRPNLSTPEDAEVGERRGGELPGCPRPCTGATRRHEMEPPCARRHHPSQLRPRPRSRGARPLQLQGQRPQPARSTSSTTAATATTRLPPSSR